MPTRRLPQRPNVAHLQRQAADLLDGQRERVPQVLQRLREFHPKLRNMSDAQIASSHLKLSDVYLAIAREYGFPSWPKLRAFVERGNTVDVDVPAHQRIADADFRRAVDLLDSGDAPALREHLTRNPSLVRQHVMLYGGNYFQNPTLLEFVAENPSRHGSLPANIADVARIILDAGARENRDALDSTLALVASSRAAATSGVQRALIDVLCEYGGDPDAGILDAVMYGEFDAVDALLARGAQVSIIAAAALGRTDDVCKRAPLAGDNERRIALALAAQHGRTEAVRALLEAGADAAGFTPPPGHSHATPLHQAALYGHEEIAQLLLRYGARLGLRDVLFGGTPADWAEYGGFGDLASTLRASSEV